MPLSITTVQNELSRALALVIRAVDSRPSLPVMACVLLEAQDDNLRVTATNLELLIVTTIHCVVDEPGRVALPAKTLYDLVGSIGAGSKLTIVQDSEFAVTVRSGKGKMKISGMDSNDFPHIPELGKAPNQTVVLPAAQLCPALDRTLYACAGSDDRPILAGLNLAFHDNVLSLCGSDGNRLASEDVVINEAVVTPFRFVIRAASLREIPRIFGEEGDITIESSQKQAIFSNSDIVVNLMLLDGKYTTDQAVSILRAPRSTSAIVSLADFKVMIKQIRIFAQDMGYRSNMILDDGTIQMTGQSKERGSAENAIDGVGEGKLEIGTNINYLLETLNSLGDQEEVMISGNEPQDFIIVRCLNLPSLIAGISPMFGAST